MSRGEYPVLAEDDTPAVKIAVLVNCDEERPSFRLTRSTTDHPHLRLDERVVLVVQQFERFQVKLSKRQEGVSTRLDSGAAGQRRASHKHR